LAGFAALWVYLWYKRKQTRLEYEVRLAHLDAEKEKELNEKKLGFFTNISHEFRTPLTLIIGPVKDLLYQKSTQTDTSGLTTVYRNARRLLSLVDQLLLFRKADTDMERLRVSKTDFGNLCHEVFLCFIQQAKSKNIKYEFLKPSEGLEIYLDREKIEIALFNLISNAMKYTQDGGSVKVELEQTKNGVRVSVADNGPGIPAEAGPKLFDKFYQVKESPGKTGFGIGLFVAKTFVESHKGRLSYKSPKEGRGTIFTIDLLEGRNHFESTTIFEDSSGGSAFLEELMEEPVEIPMLPISLPTDKVETAMNSLATEERTLLLVDDNDQIRQYVAQIFSPNFKVLQADCGEEGLKMARQHLPELVISDVVMKKMSGIELCNLIKEDAATSHIPVILLTASSAADIKLKGIENGADDYITKPFEKEQLVARVDNLLKSRNALQKYFFNEITLQKNPLKISEEYKQFLDRCMAIVEENIDRDDFSIKTLANEIGMSHSNLYKKIKSISGQSANAFIRFIRLRKAAQILIDTNCNVSEAAFQVGFNDTRYFRDQFNQLFGINPSDYIKKYRKPFQKKYTVNENVVKPSE
jgi:DNA-binding response OmpR family regulator/anti-sigma regulatory factor (Ser/Thr protein kinase)